MVKKLKTGKKVRSKQFDAKVDSGWLWTGDNLAIMAGLDDNIVDLIYLDPPFNSKSDYINVFNTADQQIEMKFRDIWTPTDDDEFILKMIGEKRPHLPAYINSIRDTYNKGMRSYLIFMGIRLLEMHRILKNTGSIYLHCDPTASHYLKGLMDGIFGKDNFRNEIVWCYTSPSNAKRDFPRKHDIILRYVMSKKWTFNADSIRVAYVKHQTGKTGGIFSEDYKLDPKGKIPETWWSDFTPVGRLANERIGYPTQKPLALLDRIIKASSNEGDLVFDPFAGCATTVISANRLNRRWISCDIAQSSVPILKRRIKQDYASEGPQLKVEGKGFISDVINPDNLPESNYSQQVKNSQKLRKFIAIEALDTDQIKYHCNGCDLALPIRLLEIDHLMPVSRGGDDSKENRILLCGHCNKSKGDKTWEEWKNKPFKKKKK